MDDALELMHDSLLDSAAMPATEYGASGALRQRGGGAAAHRSGAPVILAMTSHTAEPANECEWVTPVTAPPPRLKRSRKSEMHGVSGEAANATSNNFLEASALPDTLHRQTIALTDSFTAAFTIGSDSCGTTAAGSAFSASPSRRVATSRRSNARTALASVTAPMDDVTMMPPPPTGPPPTDGFGLEMATFGVSALAPVDTPPAVTIAAGGVVSVGGGVAVVGGGASAAESKKARHNLTERRRINRMNELFDQLSAAVEDREEKPFLIGNLTDGAAAPVPEEEPAPTEDPSNPPRSKERSGASKAKVLEGALRCIRDLRKQLAEERLARPFLSVTDLDDMTSLCTLNDSGGGGGAAVAGGLHGVDDFSCRWHVLEEINMHCLGYDQMGHPSRTSE
jgi:hypothetical protein